MELEQPKEQEVPQQKESVIKQIKLRHIFRGNSFIWLAVFILMVLSLIFIFSSTASLVYKHHPDNPGFYVIRRLRHVFWGILAILGVYIINCRRYFRWSEVLFWLGSLLVFLTYFLGKSVNKATRTLGPFQPSDFAKLGMIILLAKILTKYKDVVSEVSFLPINTWWSMLKKRLGMSKLSPKKQRKEDRENERTIYVWKNYSWIFLYPIVVTSALILPSNLSTSIVVAFMGFAVLIFGGVRVIEIIKLLFVGGCVACAGLFAVVKTGVFIRGDVWLTRLTNFFSGDDSFQSHHAKIAIAQGWIPQGPGNSVQRASLPRAESDFMFAFIVEEYSILMAVGIILIYLWIFNSAISIAKHHNNRFEALVATGLAFFISFQALIHMLVNVGIAPVTGLVLPFLSNGGSAIISMGAAIAIILKISTNQRRFQANVEREKAEQEEEEQRLSAANVESDDSSEYISEEQYDQTEEHFSEEEELEEEEENYEDEDIDDDNDDNDDFEGNDESEDIEEDEFDEGELEEDELEEEKASRKI